MESTAYKMQIEWDQKREDWFERASKYTGFHEELADIILNKLDSYHELCDLGCGSGLIDLQLYPYLDRITCIDRSAGALQLLKNKIKEKEIDNICLKQQDISSMDGIWDNCLMLFTGYPMDRIADLLSHCREKLIIVSRGGCIYNMNISPAKKHSMAPIINSLYRQKVHYEIEELELEYGQPFLDKQEAYEYLNYYHKTPAKDDINSYMLKNVFRTGSLKYPYYLLYQKKFTMFVIDRRENRHLFQ